MNPNETRMCRAAANVVADETADAKVRALAATFLDDVQDAVGGDPERDHLRRRMGLESTRTPFGRVGTKATFGVMTADQARAALARRGVR